MKFALTTLVAVVAASASYAGSPALPETVDPIIMAPAEAGADWSGLYGGAYYSTATGEDYNQGGPYLLEDDSSFYGAFAGYRHDFGSFVVGGEIATSLDVDVVEVGFPTWIVNSIVDVKATVGYDLGNVLPYAIVGYSMAEAEGFGTPYSVAGTMYGAGADWMVTDNIFVGAEYNYRFMEETDGGSYTIEMESYVLRAGYRF